MTEYEKVTKVYSRSLIPADIIESAIHLHSYLEENVIENKKHELIRQRIAKAQRTRVNYSPAARKIKVEPAGPEPIQQTKTWKCKKADKTNDFNLNPSAQAQTNEIAEGSLVIEQIKGIIVVCDFCEHRWTHHKEPTKTILYTMWDMQA
jgi:hypothetical protein